MNAKKHKYNRSSTRTLNNSDYSLRVGSELAPWLSTVHPLLHSCTSNEVQCHITVIWFHEFSGDEISIHLSHSLTLQEVTLMVHFDKMGNMNTQQLIITIMQLLLQSTADTNRSKCDYSPRLCVCVRYANGCKTFFSLIIQDVSIFSTDMGSILPPVPNRSTPASFSSLPT